MKTEIKTQNLTKMALCTAALCAASYISIPLPFTPVVLSMHTVVVNVSALLLKPKEAGMTVLVYLLLGSMGLPVFSMGSSGLGKLLGPTGGFYFGFLFSVLAMSSFRSRKISLLSNCMWMIGIGIPIQHLCAIAVMCLHNGGNIWAAFWSVSFPFLAGDVLKCVIAGSIGTALQRAHLA